MNDPTNEKGMKCPNCGEDIIEDDLTKTGCVFCSCTCDWCSHHDSREDTHFVKCNVRFPGDDIFKPSTLCEHCYMILLKEGDVKESIIDIFENLKP